MEKDKVTYGLLWNNQIIPNHGSAIEVDGPTPGPDWVGRVRYTLLRIEDRKGNTRVKAKVVFPWYRIK